MRTNEAVKTQSRPHRGWLAKKAKQVIAPTAPIPTVSELKEIAIELSAKRDAVEKKFNEATLADNRLDAVVKQDTQKLEGQKRAFEVALKANRADYNLAVQGKKVATMIELQAQAVNLQKEIGAIPNPKAAVEAKYKGQVKKSGEQLIATEREFKIAQTAHEAANAEITRRESQESPVMEIPENRPLENAIFGSFKGKSPEQCLNLARIF